MSSFLSVRDIQYNRKALRLGAAFVKQCVPALVGHSSHLLELVVAAQVYSHSPLPLVLMALDRGCWWSKTSFFSGSHLRHTNPRPLFL